MCVAVAEGRKRWSSLSACYCSCENESRDRMNVALLKRNQMANATLNDTRGEEIEEIAR